MDVVPNRDFSIIFQLIDFFISALFYNALLIYKKTRWKRQCHNAVNWKVAFNNANVQIMLRWVERQPAIPNECIKSANRGKMPRNQLQWMSNHLNYLVQQAVRVECFQL